MIQPLEFTTTSTGNGNLILVESPGSNLVTGDVFTASIDLNSDDEESNEWEIVNCTYLTAGEFSRDVVIASGNNDDFVNFSSGTKTVSIQLPPEKIIRNSTNVTIVNNAVGIGVTPTMPLHIEDSDAQILSYDTSSPISDDRPAWLFGSQGPEFEIGSTNSTSDPITNYVRKLEIAANTTVNRITFLPVQTVPAGGTTGMGYCFSSTANFGIFFGSGVPTLSAAKGSLYLRTDGSGTTDRAYINTNGSTGWTALTTAG